MQKPISNSLYRFIFDSDTQIRVQEDKSTTAATHSSVYSALASLLPENLRDNDELLRATFYVLRRREERKAESLPSSRFAIFVLVFRDKIVIKIEARFQDWTQFTFS